VWIFRVRLRVGVRDKLKVWVRKKNLLRAVVMFEIPVYIEYRCGMQPYV